MSQLPLTKEQFEHRMMYVKVGIALVLITFWGAAIIYAKFYVSTPQTIADSNKVHTLTALQSKPIAYSDYIVYNATGSFSVNNPVTVKIKVYGVSIPNLLQYNVSAPINRQTVCCIVFTHAYSSPLKYEEGMYQQANFSLTDQHNGTYTASGMVVWLQEGGTWAFLTVHNQPLLTSANTNIGDPDIVISDVSATLSWKSNETTIRLTWILIGFSVLMLQPLFEALATPIVKRGKRPKDKTPTTT